MSLYFAAVGLCVRVFLCTSLVCANKVCGRSGLLVADKHKHSAFVDLARWVKCASRFLFCSFAGFYADYKVRLVFRNDLMCFFFMYPGLKG